MVNTKPPIAHVNVSIYNIRTEEEFLTTYSREVLKATITKKDEIILQEASSLWDVLDSNQ